MQAALQDAKYLQEASQTCARLLYEEFQEAIVLARLFVTLPLKDLPTSDQAFVIALARAKEIRPLLTDKTPVLSLLGTFGAQAAWNDRYKSQTHLVPRQSEVEG